MGDAMTYGVRPATIYHIWFIDALVGFNQLSIRTIINLSFKLNVNMTGFRRNDDIAICKFYEFAIRAECVCQSAQVSTSSALRAACHMFPICTSH